MTAVDHEHEAEKAEYYRDTSEPSGPSNGQPATHQPDNRTLGQELHKLLGLLLRYERQAVLKDPYACISPGQFEEIKGKVIALFANSPVRELSLAEMEEAAGNVFRLMNPNSDWNEYAKSDLKEAKDTVNLFGQLAAACALTWGLSIPDTTRVEAGSPPTSEAKPLPLCEAICAELHEVLLPANPVIDGLVTGIIRKHFAALSVEEVSKTIRVADNGLDGDPLCVLLDEAPLIDMNTDTRAEADERIMRVCNSVAQAVMKLLRKE